MKAYQAIFFDWDGTAVASRRAPAENVLSLMEPLLLRGTPLCIISGTSYQKLAGGRLHEMLSQQALKHLYLGLDRGASNYGFADGQPVLLHDEYPSVEQKLRIDQAAFALHARLFQQYRYPTDVVFNRINYCKIDLQCELDRGDALFFHADELDAVRGALRAHGIPSLRRALELSEEIALETGIALKATTDAKFIELGVTTKSDNADYMMELLSTQYGINGENCVFFGDEFSYLDEGVMGSDAYMITDRTRRGDFFDVSNTPLRLPDGVVSLGGAVERFCAFLAGQK